MTIKPELLDILACPKCKGPVVIDGPPDSLSCSQCSLRFPVRDGIPVMLIDEAENLAEN